MAATNPLERLLDTQDVAQILGVHVQTVRRYIRDKRLPAIRITPRLYKVRWRDLERFLRENRTVDEGAQ